MKSLKTVCLLVACIVHWCFAGNPVSKADISAKWIWHQQPSYTKYNDTIIARKTFTVPRAESARITITADTRYRLWINDTWVSDGPCRSWPEQYQYDVVDVTQYLKPGENQIRVVGRYFGVGTFHQVPQQAGLLVQLDVETAGGDMIRVVSDETWEVATAAGWIPNTVTRCIQMGPLEIYDARFEDRLTFSPAAVLFDADSAPWKNLNPRDCALMTRIPIAFDSFREASVVRRDWCCFAFPTARLLYPGLIESNKKVSMASGMATMIEVPETITLHIEAPGCTVTIDGQPVMDSAHRLSPGKHFLFAAVSNYFGHWEKETEIRFHEITGYELRNPITGDGNNPWCWVPFEAAKYVSKDFEFELLGQARRTEIESTIEEAIAKRVHDVTDTASFKAAFGDQIESLSATADVMDDPHWQFTSRRVIRPAAELVQKPNALMQDNQDRTIIAPSPEGDIELVYDLGEQNVGYFAFEIEAESGLVVDVAAVEYITPDGRVQHTEQYRNCMRYICRQGVNRFMSLDRRAGRYVFMTLRNQTSPASIRHFNLVESTYPVESPGRFTCSDQELNRVWEISKRTLTLCMEDVYTDCPLYEQTLWAGDARNEGLYSLTIFGAEDITRRCATLMAQSVGKYPFALCQTPSTWDILLPAEGFMWNLSVWEYYEYSEDTEFLLEMWPKVMYVLRSTQRFCDERGLFSGPFWNAFDFADVDRHHETVLYNSMFVVGAINAALKCANALGDADAKAWLTEYRRKLVKAINSTWDDERHSYPDSIHEDGQVSNRTCVHTSFLAYLYDIVEERNEEHVLRNMTSPPEDMVRVGSPFAVMFLYEALEKAGRQEFIIDEIRNNYGPMLKAGATTVWESFPTGTLAKNGFPTRSHCHAFSSAPMYFLNRIVLGIQPAGVGGKKVVISPHPSGLTWAKGASATTNGPVKVSWQLEGDTLSIDASGPQGTKLQFETNKAIADLNVLFNAERSTRGRN